MYTNQNPNYQQNPYGQQQMQQDNYYGTGSPYQPSAQEYYQPPPVYQQQPGYPTQSNNAQYQEQKYQDQKYSYDPYHIQYTNMSVSDWNQVPNDQTPYSQYWSNEDAFQPQTVSQNMKEEKVYNDRCWCISFWINFVITIALFVWLLYEATQEHVLKDPTTGLDYIKELDWGYIGKIIGWSILIAVCINIIHAVYAIFAPKIYIKFGFAVGFIISVILSIFAIIFCSWAFIIFPIFMLIITICFYCIACRYIKFSTVVFKMTTTLLVRYPSLILYTVCQMILTTIISIIFSLIFLLIAEFEYSYFIYIYVIISYMWVSFTSGYVDYLVGAGVAATWYFLAETEYMPRYPVLESFKRAMTTSFGSAAAAGALMTAIKFIRYLVSSCQSNTDNAILACLLCILQCILGCIEAFISWMNKYGLIYCAIFGVPYTEGCRRYIELSCKKFCDVIMRSSIISIAIAFNLLIFVIGSGILGFAVGYWLYDELISEIYICCFTIVFAMMIFEVISNPIDVIPDTIMICFVEDPSRLMTTAHEMYEIIEKQYKEGLEEVVNS